MTPERLAGILDTYGAKPARWPDAERAAALQRLTVDAAATQRLRDEALLDVLLDCSTVPAPDAAMIQRATAAFRQHHGLAILRKWWVGCTLASAALAGAVAGTLVIAVAMPRFEDQQLLEWVDAQPTLFTPVDIGEGAP